VARPGARTAPPPPYPHRAAHLSLSLSREYSLPPKSYVSVCQHTTALFHRVNFSILYIRQHTTAYVSIRQHMSAYDSIRQHTTAYVSIRQHTTSYDSIRQHTSAYVIAPSICCICCVRTCWPLSHTPAYVSIRQHTSAYVRIREHLRQHT